MKKQTKTILWVIGFILLLGVVGFGLVHFGLLQQTALSNQYYETAFYSYVSCDVCGSVSTTQGVGSQAKLISYKESAGDTTSWDLDVQAKGSSYFQKPLRLYTTVNGVQQAYDFADTLNVKNMLYNKLTSLRPGDIVRIYYEQKNCNLLLQCTWDAKSDSSFIYYVKATPYCLFRYNMLAGGKIKVNSRDCEVTQSIYDNQILSESVSQAQDSGTGNKINPSSSAAITPYTHIAIGSSYNYVSDFVTVPSFTLENYNGQLVKCINDGTTRIYYGFSPITTPQGTHNILDFNKVLGNPQCCERESTPEKTCQDGKWILHEEAQCSLVKPCVRSSYNPNPQNSKQLVKYVCSNSKCVAQYKDVQCTSSGQCGANQICDANWNCIDSGTNPIPPIVNCTTCPECIGCENKCPDKLGGLIMASPYTANTQVCTSQFLFICLHKEPVTTSGCAYDYTLIWVFALVIVIIVITIIVLASKRARRAYPRRSGGR